MARFVALFRGINVGKAKRIAMADLRALLESLGGWAFASAERTPRESSSWPLWPSWRQAAL